MIINTLPCPELNQFDDITSIVTGILSNETIKDGDIIALPKSVTYFKDKNTLTVGDIAEAIESYEAEKAVIIYTIYNLDRFTNIIKGIARGIKDIIIISPYVDELGNEIKDHPYTGFDYDEKIKEIIEAEGASLDFHIDSLNNIINRDPDLVNELKEADLFITLSTHSQLIEEIEELLPEITNKPLITLKDLCGEEDFGLIGLEQVDDYYNKVLSTKSELQSIVDGIKSSVKLSMNKDIEVMIYGNGLYQDSKETIWEYIDPTCFSYTSGLEGSTTELTPKPYVDIISTISNLIQKTESPTNIVHISGFELN